MLVQQALSHSVDDLQMVTTSHHQHHQHTLAQQLSHQLSTGNVMGGNNAAAAAAAAAIAGLGVGVGVCPSTLSGLTAAAGGGNILITTSSPIIPGGTTTVVFATHAAAAMAAMGGATVVTTCDGGPGVGVPGGTVLVAAPVGLTGMPPPRM